MYKFYKKIDNIIEYLKKNYKGNIINWGTIFYGFLLALSDVVVLPLLKYYYSHKLHTPLIIAMCSIIYAFQPIIFLQSLNYESMLAMNIIWDVASDLLVSLAGIFLFNEHIGYYKRYGIIVSFIALFLMAIE